MILEQHHLACLAQASYFIADPRAGVAAVVDPRRDIDVYLAAAEQHGVRIEWVILTHFHADFVSGHIELRERTGAKIAIGAQARAEFEFTPLADGDEIALGEIRLRALETPGHTPESICVLVFETPDAEAPHAVLTGDTLFIGDVGRPDLMASVGVSAAELATSLYESTRNKLLPLPDATLVYPGHGAGSMCGKNLSTDTVSTIGDQRTHNAALQTMPCDDFVALVTDGQPRVPQYFPEDAKLNRTERGTLDAMLETALRPLDVGAAMALVDAGACILDCRDAETFARGHLPGSVWVGLDGKFATWAGTVIALDREVVLCAEPDRVHEAATRLGRIGHDRIAGCVIPGHVTGDTPEFSGRWTRRDVAQVRVDLDGPARPHVLDVRTPGEWAAGRIDGAQHIPLIELAERHREVPRDRDITIVCGSGYRSLIAMSLLEPLGVTRLRDLRGGMTAWGA